MNNWEVFRSTCVIMWLCALFLYSICTTGTTMVAETTTVLYRQQLRGTGTDHHHLYTRRT